MTSLPKRRKPTKMNCNSAPQVRSAGHLKWIRGHECSVAGGITTCGGRIEAAHVRTGTDGALGMKPSDCWAIPLCSIHHAGQHRVGEKAFERAHSIDMRKIAQALWSKSPHAKKQRTP
jgi:hypothetical protein